ncbi:MAG: aspartate/glutamate racemase family protein, partial [Candidatus Methanomethylicia archaeon]
EFYRMAPEGVSIHTARMRLVEAIPEELMEMEKYSEKAARELMDADVNILVYGCTTGSLIGGLDFDLKLAGRLESISRLPVVATATAVVEALRELKIKKIIVATPYIDSLNVKEKEFLEGRGFKVINIKGLNIRRNTEIGRQNPITAYKLVREIFTQEAEGIFVSCTNFRTIEVIELVEKDFGRPVVTSNQATMWATLRKLGIHESITGYGKLLREHL